jgi:hypothetical protein
VRAQYNAGKLPPTVLTAWLAELENARLAVTQPVVQETQRVTRDDLVKAYRSALAKRLGVCTKRENAGPAREAYVRCLRAVASRCDQTWKGGSSKALPRSTLANFS